MKNDETKDKDKTLEKLAKLFESTKQGRYLLRHGMGLNLLMDPLLTSGEVSAYKIDFPEWLPKSVRLSVKIHLTNLARVELWAKTNNILRGRNLLMEYRNMLKRLCTYTEMRVIYEHLDKHKTEHLSLLFFEEVINLRHILDGCKTITEGEYHEWISALIKATSALKKLLDSPPSPHIISSYWFNNPLDALAIVKAFYPDIPRGEGLEVKSLKHYREKRSLPKMLSLLLAFLERERETKPIFLWEIDGMATYTKKIKNKGFHKTNFIKQLKLFFDTKVGKNPKHDKYVADVIEIALDLSEDESKGINAENIRKRT